MSFVTETQDAAGLLSPDLSVPKPTKLSLAVCMNPKPWSSKSVLRNLEVQTMKSDREFWQAMRYTFESELPVWLSWRGMKRFYYWFVTDVQLVEISCDERRAVWPEKPTKVYASLIADYDCCCDQSSFYLDADFLKRSFLNGPRRGLDAEA